MTLEIDNNSKNLRVYWQDLLRFIWLSDSSRPWNIYSGKQFSLFWDGHIPNSEVIEKDPNSKYAEEAKQRIDAITKYTIKETAQK